jgi:mannose-1-phosphate guanylyltransferase
MKKPVFYAAILSGGSGERFWPLSTPKRPKQFLSVFGGKSLIRQAVERLSGLVPPERILVITAKSLVAATRAELPEIPCGNIVAEPCRRDTAAAVATACGVVEARGGESAVVAILTADQIMGDVKAFRRVLSDSALAAARSDSIVTMGIAPAYPATGFGYINVGGPLDLGTATEFRRAVKFVEKPDAATAKRYLATGR